MPRDIAIILDENIEAIAGIDRAIEFHGLKALDHDWLLQRGVERGIEIVSEAVRHPPDELLARRPDIPWPGIRGIGNRIRHECQRVSPRFIRSVVTDDLPALLSAVEAMKKSLLG
jgi:uncharacterized protein with HEPN domain